MSSDILENEIIQSIQTFFIDLANEIIRIFNLYIKEHLNIELLYILVSVLIFVLSIYIAAKLLKWFISIFIGEKIKQKAKKQRRKRKRLFTKKRFFKSILGAPILSIHGVQGSGKTTEQSFIMKQKAYSTIRHIKWNKYYYNTMNKEVITYLKNSIDGGKIPFVYNYNKTTEFFDNHKYKGNNAFDLKPILDFMKTIPAGSVMTIDENSFYNGKDKSTEKGDKKVEALHRYARQLGIMIILTGQADGDIKYSERKVGYDSIEMKSTKYYVAHLIKPIYYGRLLFNLIKYSPHYISYVDRYYLRKDIQTEENKTQESLKDKPKIESKEEKKPGIKEASKKSKEYFRNKAKIKEFGRRHKKVKIKFICRNYFYKMTLKPKDYFLFDTHGFRKKYKKAVKDGHFDTSF